MDLTECLSAEDGVAGVAGATGATGPAGGAGSSLIGLSPNAGYAKVAPKLTPLVGAANFGGAVGNTSFEFITVGGTWCVRQNGTIEQMSIYMPSLAGLTAVYLQLWRKDIGVVTPTYRLVGSSENVLSKITAADASPITLTSPIASIKEGDYYGLRLEWAAGCTADNLCARTAQSYVTTYSLTNQATPAAGFGWESQTAHAGIEVSVSLYMTRPILVAIGDSMIQGGICYTDGSTVDYTASPHWAYSVAHYVARPFGYAYQCVAIGGEPIETRAARFNADVVSFQPRLAIVYGGTAGLGSTTTTELFTDSYRSMLTACVANNIIPIVFLIFPSNYSGFTITYQRLRDEWNRILLAMLITEFPSAVIVDTEPFLGLKDIDGPDGNLWNLPAIMTFDTIHLSNLGRRIAASVAVTAMSVK